MGDVIKGIGKVVGAIPSGVGHALATSGIPLVSNVGGDIEKVGQGLTGKLPFFKGVLGGGAPLAGMALGGMGLAGEGPLAGMLSGAGSKIGQGLESTFMPGGKLDMAKALGAVGSVANLTGAAQQRKSAQDYANAQIGQRNALMSKILGPQNYGLPAPNLNQQSSATPGIGAGSAGGY